MADPIITEARVHDLKCWTQFFEKVLSGEKTFEVRVDDRGYRAGDVLRLRDFDRWAQQYTDRSVDVSVTYLMAGPAFGLEKGWVVMGFTPPAALAQARAEGRLAGMEEAARVADAIAVEHESIWRGSGRDGNPGWLLDEAAIAIRARTTKEG